MHTHALKISMAILVLIVIGMFVYTYLKTQEERAMQSIIFSSHTAILYE
jgi:hypothetical protein